MTPLASCILSEDTPNWAAMTNSVSPGCTMYTMGVGVTVAVAVGAGVAGAGVDVGRNVTVCNGVAVGRTTTGVVSGEGVIS
jgi:hypothetical protein